MWISLKLFLEVSVNRKSDSWDVSTFKSIVLNVMKSTGDCLEVNNAEWGLLNNQRDLLVGSLQASRFRYQYFR